MKRAGLFTAFFFSLTLVHGQGPVVPEVILFADMELHLNDQVRKEIQLDVDNLRRSPKYFNIKLERVNQYFPIIERILKTERVPEDFKYLVIQESALIPDAVSSANAIGFWQFKKPAGQEVGLRIDASVDERMNIVSSTHGAAKYLKTNNFYFKNWMYALLAYNTGRGGAEAHIDRKHFGDKKMVLNRKTHWYVKKFLAHKIAFEDGIRKNPDSKIKLYEYTDGGGKTLAEISQALKVDEDQLNLYNKWLRRGRIPTDKVYTVIVPGVEVPKAIAARKSKSSDRNEELTSANRDIKKIQFSPDRDLYPVIREGNFDHSRIAEINDKPGIVAGPGDNIKTLAAIGGLSLQKFMKFNDIEITHKVEEGQVYYFKRKRNKADEYYHVVYPGEDTWTISQKYGVKEKKLLRKNRFRNDEVNVKPGLVLWLRFIRPADYPVEYGDFPKEQSNPPVTKKNVITQEKSVPDNKQEQKKTIEANKIEKQEDENEITMADPDSRTEKTVQGTSSTEKNTEKEYYNTKNETPESDLEPDPLFHIVEANETLYSISRKYGIPLSDLIEFNALDSEATIRIGEKIYLKEPFPESDRKEALPEKENTSRNSYILHTVATGETMYSISRKYQVTVDEIMKINDKSDFTIKEGEKLQIPAR